MIVFIDTLAFYALLSSTDEQHADAIAYWDDIILDTESQLVTSNYILIETCALLRHRLGMRAVEIMHREILPALTILWVDEFTHFAATEAMLTAGNRGQSGGLFLLCDYGCQRYYPCVRL